MATTPEVDEQGRPETPVEQAVEKRKHRNVTYAALALGAIGVVVTIVLARNRSASASGGYTYPTGLGTSGTVAGTDTATTDNSQYGALLASLEADQAGNTAALAGLNASLTKLEAELRAQNGVHHTKPPVKDPAYGKNGLVKLNAALFARILPRGTKVEQIGTLGGGGVYTGHNVKAGAPVYANVMGTWQQFDPHHTPAGTRLGVPAALHQYVTPAVSTTHLY